MYVNPSDRLSSLTDNAIPTIHPGIITPIRRPPPKKRKISSPTEKPFKKPLDSPKFSTLFVDIPTTPTTVITSVSTSSISLNTPQSSCNKHTCYRLKYNQLRKKNLALHGQICRLQKKLNLLKLKTKPTRISPKKSLAVLKNANFNPILARFVESQHEYYNCRKKGMRWTSSDLKLAISVWYKSPSTYKHLRQFFGLPTMTVIYDKLKLTMAQSGICRRTLEGLRYKVEDLSEIEKSCALAMDGMKIDSCLQYMKNDIISGFEELAGHRTSIIATELVAVMIQGLASHWKQVGVY